MSDMDYSAYEKCELCEALVKAGFSPKTVQDHHNQRDTCDVRKMLSDPAFYQVRDSLDSWDSEE